MQRVIGLMAVAVLFLAGCATTQKAQESQMQQLQDRITYLESELDKTHQQVQGLESELVKTQEASVVAAPKTTHKNIRVEGVSVSDVQAALKNAGHYSGNIDGKMGPQTKEAVKAFQAANDLNPDGVVGKKTWSLLNK
ncbi:MAG: peptidoglycan-binding protein [Candidatus Omnitrophota bacterium]